MTRVEVRYKAVRGCLELSTLRNKRRKDRGHLYDPRSLHWSFHIKSLERKLMNPRSKVNTHMFRNREGFQRPHLFVMNHCLETRALWMYPHENCVKSSAARKVCRAPILLRDETREPGVGETDRRFSSSCRKKWKPFWERRLRAVDKPWMGADSVFEFFFTF